MAENDIKVGSLADVNSLLDSINDREFEKLIGRLYEKKGYHVTVTKKSGDFGIDVLAEKEGEKIAIQCKCYKNEQKVDNSTIQKAIGAAHSPYKVGKVAVITTSSFSAGAISVAKSANVPVELIDRIKLVAELVTYYYDIKDSPPEETILITDRINAKEQENIISLRHTIKSIRKELGMTKLSIELVAKRWGFYHFPVENFEEFKKAFEEVCKIDGLKVEVDWDKKREKIENLLLGKTEKIDIDKIATGIGVQQRSNIMLIKEILKEIGADFYSSVPLEDIFEAAKAKGLTQQSVEEAIEKLRRTGDVFEPRRGFLSRLID